MASNQTRETPSWVSVIFCEPSARKVKFQASISSKNSICLSYWRWLIHPTKYCVIETQNLRHETNKQIKIRSSRRLFVVSRTMFWRFISSTCLWFCHTLLVCSMISHLSCTLNEKLQNMTFSPEWNAKQGSIKKNQNLDQNLWTSTNLHTIDRKIQIETL